jgi:hypothetical protein
MSAIKHPSLDAKPEMGLHGLKDLLKTREYLRDHCEFLAPVIGLAAKTTREAASTCLRSKKKLSYLGLRRKPGALLVHPEVQFERAMVKRWTFQDGQYDSGWHRVIDYQVPVKDRMKSVLGLKAIDLLGIDLKGLPIIIELKIVRQEKGADTPLMALLEAASYACVIQMDWQYFKNQLEAKNKLLAITEPLPEKLDQVPLVIAGPPEYWDFWNYEARSSVIEAKPAFRILVDAFRREGFPISFTSVAGSLADPQTLTATRARFLD